MFQKTGKFLILVIGLICLAGLSVFAQTEISINKHPLRDFAQFVNEKVTAKEVDLNAEFLIELEGVLNKTGKFDIKQTKFTKSEGDKQIVDIAKTAIEAVNDSGWLVYLKELGVSKIFVKFQQDKENITVNIKSEMESNNRANAITSMVRTLLMIGKLKKQQEIEGMITNKASLTDEIRLLESLNSSSEGKFFVLNFSMAQGVKQEMIERRLKELNEQN
jgi:hypothetical protein